MLSHHVTRRAVLVTLLLSALLGVVAAQAAPRRGGDMVFAQEAQVSGLDMHFSSAISSRNIAMHMYESLLTRDESNAPIAELAEKWVVSPDGLTYTFPLRKGVLFHNGKEMTSADVLASFQRYQRLGVDKKILDPVASLAAPEKYTFQIKLKKAVPTFLEELSSFRVPIVIMPAEETSKAGGKSDPYIGTGPYQFVEWIPDSHVRLKRFEKYKVNEAFPDRTGFGGRKIAYFDTVTFKIVTEGGARVAGLEKGEFHAVEDVPTKSAQRLQGTKSLVLYPLERFWIHIGIPNFSKAPTDNLLVRRAIQAGLNMEEIMEAATDGAYKLQAGYQYPGNPYYVEAGKEKYNLNDRALAQRLLREGGYKNEEVVLITNQDYQTMYNAAVVMAEQMKAFGTERQGRGLRLADPAEEARGPEGLEHLLHGLRDRALGGRGGGHPGPRAADGPPDVEGRPGPHPALRGPRQQAHVRGAEGRLREGAGADLRPGARHQVRGPDQGPGGPRQREGLQAVPDPADVERLVRGVGTAVGALSRSDRDTGARIVPPCPHSGLA